MILVFLITFISRPILHLKTTIFFLENQLTLCKFSKKFFFKHFNESVFHLSFSHFFHFPSFSIRLWHSSDYFPRACWGKFRTHLEQKIWAKLDNIIAYKITFHTLLSHQWTICSFMKFILFLILHQAKSSWVWNRL